MAALSPLFDAELLRRYDTPGPRYTSYPTAPQLSCDFRAPQLRQMAQASNDEDAARPLSLYVHVPFCSNPCFHCSHNRLITRDASRSGPYLDRIANEVRMLAPLFDAQRQVQQVHVGGGTPNFLWPAQIASLLDTLRGNFSFAPPEQIDCSIELDPRFIPPADVAQLAQAGVNRAHLGVQDFDADVQRAINREQDVDGTLAIMDACREQGMRSVTLQLVYGLPKQTLRGFMRTLDIALRARPERLTVHGYTHLPALFRPQKQIRLEDLPSAELKLELLRCAIDLIGEAGYVYLGMDHFALPDDDLALAQARGALRRDFMGYTAHADSDLIGFGVSAFSRIGASFSQNPRDLQDWEQAIDAGHLPVWRGMKLDDDDRLRADVIQQLMCHGRIVPAAIEQAHGIVFGDYFADALARMQPLMDDGLVEAGSQALRVTSRGRMLLRVVAMCFDRYLPAVPAASTSRFSRTA